MVFRQLTGEGLVEAFQSFVKNALTLSAILTFGLLIGACSDPDERLPWPTAVPELKIMDMSGVWNMACISEENDTSVRVEARIDAEGSFKVREYYHLTKDCTGIAIDLRTRTGQAHAVENYNDGTQLIEAKVAGPYREGDLMVANAVIARKDGVLTLRPLKAEYFGLSEKRVRLWDDKLEDMMVLNKIGEIKNY